MFDTEFWMMILKLIVFLPCILLMIYLFVRIGGNKFQSYQNSKFIKIIDRVPVSKENSLLVVKIGGRAYVMSSTKENMEIILELSKEELVILESKKNTVEMINIKETFEKLKGKKEDYNE
jgi:flagellar protein FliO/FliZ